MRIIEKNGLFHIVFPYRPHLVEQVRSIPGRRWDPTKKVWTVPVSSRRSVENFARKNRFSINGHGVPAPLKNMKIPELPDLKINIELKRELYPFQKNGVAYSLEKKKLIVGDSMGLGKTCQAIATISAAKAFPCLVICPASLKLNWQREWQMWTDRKAMILSNQNKDTWQHFADPKSNLFGTGAVADIFITNYESLKKFFVHSIKKPTGRKLRITDITFKQTISVFKSVIIDESHRCLPYETKVLTDQGWIMIGDIVEKGMKNLLVASMDIATNTINYKPILNLWKNDNKGRVLHRIQAGKCSIEVTHDHHIYVVGQGWKEAVSIRNSEDLYVLWETFLDKKDGQNHFPVLHQNLRRKSGELLGTCQKENIRSKSEASDKKSVCLLWQVLLHKITRDKVAKKKILFSKLFGKMESPATRDDCNQQIRGKKGKAKSERFEADAESFSSANAFGKNEEEKSNAYAWGKRKNDRVKKRANIFISWWKRSINRATEKALECITSTEKIIGIRYFYTSCQGSISVPSVSLQSRHSAHRKENSYRGRRVYTYAEEVEIPRQEENRGVERVGVESNTILEPRDYERLARGPQNNQYLYDLEIADNHNYFANGILVSNCKEPSTLQAKLTKGICSGKEYILALTGTPVVNKPRDLVSQLAIIEQLPRFGGYQNFLKRYCEDWNGAENLEELNYLLKKNCFYRRDKGEVLKDLPAKVRHTVPCDITTRKEYKEALADLEIYLKKYRQATDEQIARSMKGEVMVRIGILKNISARGKLNDVVEYIQDVVESDEKIVVFVHLREVAAYLKQMFPAAVTILGEDDTRTRQRNIDKFQNDPECQVIICSIKAAGVGITLTASSRVAFVELPWHPADSDQAEDRLHRIGQQDSVQCTYFLGRNTIDEWIYKIIAEKREISNTITGARDEVEESVMDSVINLFNQRK